MKYIALIRDQALLCLKWAGDAAHRRALVGSIVGISAVVFHHNLDSTLVDNILIVLVPALAAAWGRHTPEIAVTSDTVADDKVSS